MVGCFREYYPCRRRRYLDGDSIEEFGHRGTVTVPTGGIDFYGLKDLLDGTLAGDSVFVEEGLKREGKEVR